MATKKRKPIESKFTVLVPLCDFVPVHPRLMADIRNRLNARVMRGTPCTIISITQPDSTRLSIKVGWSMPSMHERVQEHLSSYIHGLVGGILLWSGFEIG